MIVQSKDQPKHKHMVPVAMGTRMRVEKSVMIRGLSEKGPVSK